MNNYNKWVIELANQEYNGSISAVLRAISILGGC